MNHSLADLGTVKREWGELPRLRAALECPLYLRAHKRNPERRAVHKFERRLSFICTLRMCHVEAQFLISLASLRTKQTISSLLGHVVQFLGRV